MENLIALKYGEDALKNDKVQDYLNTVTATSNINNRGVYLINNYTHKMSKTTILSLIDTIRKNELIVAGGGCLFLPHKQKRNLLIEFIIMIMGKRAAAKKARRQYDKGTEGWITLNRAQNSFKLIINSLYGCLGYPGFILFNIFIAESITTGGKHIITSAIGGVENFLGDGCYFVNESDMLNVVNNIHSEYKRKVGEVGFEAATIALLSENLDVDELHKIVTMRYLEHCKFVISKTTSDNIVGIFKGMCISELLMFYYKNNLMAFNNLSVMKEKYKTLVEVNGELTFCEIESYNPEAVPMVEDIWKMLNLMVHYNYPIYDRMRKAAYLNKRRSLYTDTDSVFVSVDEYVKYIIGLNPNVDMDEFGLRFTAANISLTYVNKMIAATMKTFYRSMNTADDYGWRLNMKNEFFFQRILFVDKKKRYISLALLQEGQALFDKKGNRGLPEVKGFDFIKANVKPRTREFYETLCIKDIIRAESINPIKVFSKVMGYRKFMYDAIMTGNMEFFKQANVKIMEHYKKPYSTQGICAILIWNALYPEKHLELPTDVNIVPIKQLTFPKPPKSKVDIANGVMPKLYKKTPLDITNIRWYANKHPDAYKRLYNSFYGSENPLLRHMNISYVAIPKNLDYELPEFITDLIDTDKIIDDNIQLITPVLMTLGIQSFQLSSTKEAITNMLEI